jgi:TP901 family phage tail tape measure protein
MTERVETVRLLANVSNYIAGMETARAKTAAMTADSTARLAAQRQAFTQVGLAVTAIGVVAAAAVAVSVAKFAEFDQAMSNVKAITQETADNMALLRQAALDAGAATVFTAVEAAHAIEELGKNGVTTTQILNGGLSGALALASAGQLDVARAAEVAAISMKQFGLEGKDIPHIADLLAAGAGKAAGDVEDLAMALAQSGLVANQTGLSIEETTGILAAFADAGLVGSDAGTSLKTALQRLTPISGEAQKAMDDLGISAYDGQGAFIGAAKFAGVLQERLSGLTAEQRNAALAQIFGTDAVRAAAVLYEQGADGITRYIEQTNESGYAAKVAADRLDNLKGDVEKLGGAFDTFAIQGGSAANETLRGVVQGLTLLLDIAGDLPQPVLDAGLAVGAVAASLALAAGAAFTLIPKIVDLKSGLDNLNISGRTASIGVGLAGGAIALAGFVLVTFITQAVEARGRIDSLAGSLDKATSATTDYTDEVLKSQLQSSGAVDIARRLGISYEDLRAAALGLPGAYDEVVAAGVKASAGNALLAGDLDALQFYLGRTSGELKAAAEQNEYFANGADGAAESSRRNADELAGLEGAAVGAGTEIDKLAEQIRGFADATLNTRDAQREFQAAVDDAAASLSENGATLDINTEQGRANEATLDAIARASKEVAASLIEQSDDQVGATAAIAAGRAELINTLAQYGITGQAAEDYADKLGLIPSNIGTVADLNTEPAMAKLRAIKDSFAAFQSSGLNLTAYIRTVDGRADGGPIIGVGGPRQDNIPIMASAGEHMLSVEDVQRLGGHAGVYAMRRSLYQGLADGGPVRPIYMQPTYMAAPQHTIGSMQQDAGFSAVFQLAPLPGRSLAEQVFEAARRMKVRR